MQIFGVSTTVLAFVLLCNTRFNFHCYTQRGPTPTQKSARKWQVQPFATSSTKDYEGHSLVQTSFAELPNMMPRTQCCNSALWNTQLIQFAPCWFLWILPSTEQTRHVARPAVLSSGQGGRYRHNGWQEHVPEFLLLFSSLQVLRNLLLHPTLIFLPKAHLWRYKVQHQGICVYFFRLNNTHQEIYAIKIINPSRYMCILLSSK